MDDHIGYDEELERAVQKWAHENVVEFTQFTVALPQVLMTTSIMNRFAQQPGALSPSVSGVLNAGALLATLPMWHLAALVVENMYGCIDLRDESRYLRDITEICNLRALFKAPSVYSAFVRQSENEFLGGSSSWLQPRAVLPVGAKKKRFEDETEHYINLNIKYSPYLVLRRLMQIEQGITPDKGKETPA